MAHGTGLLGLLAAAGVPFHRGTERRAAIDDSLKAVEANSLAQQLYDAQRRSDVKARVDENKQLNDMYDAQWKKDYSATHPESDADFALSQFRQLHPELYRSQVDTEILKNDLARRKLAGQMGTAEAVGRTGNEAEIDKSLTDIDTGKTTRATNAVTRTHGTTAMEEDYKNRAARAIRERATAERGMTFDPGIELADSQEKLAGSRLRTAQSTAALPNVPAREQANFATEQEQAKAAQAAAGYQANLLGAQSPFLAAGVNDARNQDELRRIELLKQQPAVRPDIRIPDMTANTDIIKSLGNAQFGTTALPPDASGIVMRGGTNVVNKPRVIHKF